MPRYLESLTRDNGELERLLDSVPMNLTRFFRNAKQLEALRRAIVQGLAEGRADDPAPLRVWSAGCSSGEEPYTLAMVLREALPADRTVEITATDLSLASLAVGRSGVYGERSVDRVPPRYRTRYFTRCPGGLRVCDSIRSMVRFEHHNLIHDAGYHDVDVVVCRNVLVYFDAAVRRAVVARFRTALRPGGFLLVGRSESLAGIRAGFESIGTEEGRIYRARVRAAAGADS